MRILAVDDDRRLLEVIKKGLAEEAYAVDAASDGEEGLHYAETGVYDLIVLDIMMPKMDGLALLRSLRSRGLSVPILMLTAKDAVEDIVAGLDAGADDYLVKPFAFGELLARVRALTRRRNASKSPLLQAGDLTLDTVTREVKRDGKPVALTTKEYMVLQYFMRHPGVLITRTMLEDHAWDEAFDAESNVVDVFVRRIRRKIDRDGEESMIETVRGAGYRLRSP
jgi:DNA-binding response OmpR family regulator